MLAPHSCRGCGRIGMVLCDRCKNYIISEHATYQPKFPSDFLASLDANAAIFVLGARTGLVGKMVHDLKYDSVRALARALAELLDATLPEFRGAVSIVPLPTSTKHIRARGLDHTLLIAKRLAKLRGYRVEKLLMRAKNTTQVGASAAERQAQAAQAYAVQSGATVDDRTTYLLLDDVWTTGASMQAALNQFRTLRPKRVQLVLLARN